MATPDPRFIAMFPLQEYFVDKTTGAPLSAGLITFYKDSARTVFKDVYQQSQSPSGDYIFTNLGHSITLTSVGTPGDESGNDIIPFLFPYQGTPENTSGKVELYFITVYATEDDIETVFQFSREAWPPVQLGKGSTANEPTESINELSNPQFSVVNFLADPTTGAYIYSVSGTNTETVIAPGWLLQTTGTGTITVKQVAESDVQVPSNPPYVLDLQGSSGVTSWRLIQRLTSSPRLLVNGIVAGYFIARTASGSAEYDLELLYIPSNASATNRLIVTGTTAADGNWVEMVGNIDIPGSGGVINTDIAPDGYIDIALDIPSNSHIQVSSFQIVGIPTLLASDSQDFPIFEQQSTQQQLSGMMWYYEPQLAYKPIPSYLVGWDFPLNPAQFSGRTVPASAIGANKSQYVWDQTIIFQSADSGVGVTGGSAGEIVLTAAATTQMALIQYLPATEARELLNGNIAVNIAAKASGATNASVSLWYTTDSTLPVITSGTNNSIVLTLDSNGVPATKNGTWSQVPFNGQTNGPTFTIGTSANVEFNDYNFSGWSLDGIAAANTATFFAIVIGTASVTSTGTVSIYSVGLNKGDIATRPAPLTPDQTLKVCERYYEKSYESNIYAGSASVVNQLALMQMAGSGGGNTVAWATAFGLVFNTIKYSSTPTVILYSPASGAANTVSMTAVSSASITTSNVATTAWTQTGVGAKGVSYLPATSTDLVSTSGGNISRASIAFQYISQAVLGGVV
jgi:hypothetical protein